ncbi:restriction endonuclease subunit S domain-containing protein [Pedococcus soli]
MSAFDEVLEDVSGGNPKLPQSAFLSTGRFPVVDQGQRLVAGFSNDPSKLCSVTGPVIVFGDHTRAFKYIDFPFIVGADGVKVLRVRPGWDPKYVFHYLRSRDIPSAGYSRHFKFLKQIEVPRPPKEEQLRITAMLDLHDDLRSKSRESAALADELTHSIYFDMFGDPEECIRSGRVIPFSEVVADLRGGKSLVASDTQLRSQNRVLKISAVTTGHFRPHESKPLPDDYQPPHDHFVRSNDLLMSRANTTALVGAVALARSVPKNLVLPDKIWRFVWRDPASVEPLFVWSLLRTPAMRRQLSARSSGTGGSMKNISKEKLKAMPLVWPDHADQMEFATRLTEALRVGEMHDDRLLAELGACMRSRAFGTER